MLKARMLALTLLLTMPGCAPFVAVAPTLRASAVGCSTLVPEAWRSPVEGAELPADGTVGGWMIFGDQQTGRLDMANDRTISAIGIVERCEARDAQAIARATRRRFLGLF